MNHKEIASLIKLLDDPDEEISTLHLFLLFEEVPKAEELYSQKLIFHQRIQPKHQRSNYYPGR